jgi:hypothetical protein
MSKPEFVYTTYIETTAEKLWQALTDGDFTERYWFGHRVTKGWPAILASLKSLVETGTALAIPFAALGIEGME